MKRVTAIEASDGSLHKTRRAAAIASIGHLAIRSNDFTINSEVAAFMVRKRAELVAILQAIDAAEEEQAPEPGPEAEVKAILDRVTPAPPADWPRREVGAYLDGVGRLLR